MPLCTLLGGNHQDDILLYRAISQGTPKEMSALVQKYKTMVCIILVEFKEFYVLKHPTLYITYGPFTNYVEIILALLD